MIFVQNLILDLIVETLIIMIHRILYLIVETLIIMIQKLVNRHLSYICWFQKLPKIVAERCGIEVDGEVLLAGLRLGARGAITTIAYKVDPMDGHIILGTEGGWNNFLVSKNLQVGQAIIITIKNTAHANLSMMVVIDII